MNWNEPYRLVDEYKIGEGGQRVLHLNRKYGVGLGDIKVYYNGLSATKGREYNEIDTYTIEFTYELVEGDTIEVEYLKMW